jgi:endonuclease YncB( thermonuclease family)
MQIVLTCVVAGVAGVQSWPTNAPLTRSPSAVVQSVGTETTIDIAAVGRVKLSAIAVPSGFEREALERLTSLVLHRWVHLEREGQTIGQSRWRQAYVVREDGLFVNAALVRDGLARVTSKSGSRRGVELEQAEAEARTARRGMWASGSGYTSRARPARPNP